MKKKSINPFKPSEHDIQKAIVKELLKSNAIILGTDIMSGLGYLGYNQRARIAFITHHKAMGYTNGQSDIVIAYKGKIYFVEIKTEDGKLSKEQKLFESRVKEQGLDYLVWRSVQDVINFLHKKPFSV